MKPQGVRWSARLVWGQFIVSCFDTKYFCLLLFSRRADLLRLMQTRVGGRGSALYCHGNVPMATHSSRISTRVAAVRACTPVCFPGAFQPNTQAVCRRFGGGNLQAHPSCLSGGTVTRNCYATAPGQTGFTQVLCCTEI